MTHPSLLHGDRFPYDHLQDEDWDGKDGEKLFPPVDWAHRAARGVIANLLDRRTVKWALEDVDADVRQEMIATLAQIIRDAHDAQLEVTP